MKRFFILVAAVAALTLIGCTESDYAKKGKEMAAQLDQAVEKQDKDAALAVDKAIREAGMSTSNSPVFRLAPSQDGAYADLRDLLNAGEKPAKCYFADNDLIAIGAMQALKEAGYRIPEDVSVVGFDDISSSEYVSPPLTTIQVPKTTLGETAVVRVAQMIEGKNRYPLKIEVSTRLIRRKSVTGS